MRLHDDHRALFDFVIGNHPKVIVVLGSSAFVGTRNNPLDIHSRKMMIQEAYPSVDVPYVKDMPSDSDWSKALDSIINDNISRHVKPLSVS